MKTIEIEVAMMMSLGVRQNLIVPNVSWGMWASRGDGGSLHECDILCLSQRGYATEIEIKVSKHDLFKDSGKQHQHDHNLIARLYFAVPKELQEVALANIPERAGLYVVEYKESTWYGHDLKTPTVTSRRVVTEIRGAKRNPNALIWSDDQRYQLARLGAMRILGLKQKIFELSNKEK